MTAVASTRDSSNRPTRRATLAAESPTVDYADVPVLLRLPNLDRPVGGPEVGKDVATPPVDEARTARTNGRTHRTDTRQTTDNAEANSAAPITHGKTSTPKVLALLWRAGIVIAAIGLVVLAYRIINGPPTSEVAVPGDMYSDMTTDMPTISVPVVTMDKPPSPNVQEFAAPKFAAPQLATPLADGPSHDQQPHLGGEVPALDETKPSTASKDSQPQPAEFATQGSPTPGWDTATTDEFSGAQARPWNESTVAQFDNQQPSNHEAQQRPWAGDDSSRPDFADNASSNNYQEIDNGTASAYPETDPRSWRTPQQWDEAAAFGQPATEPGYDSWQDNSRSAARLRPEIEQPPLRR